MVSADGDLGDGVARPYQYARFRDDKKASEGYSPELVNIGVPDEFLDENYDQQPLMRFGEKTLLELFK